MFVDAVVGGEGEPRARAGDAADFAQGLAALFAAGDLHQAVKAKNRAVEFAVAKSQSRGVADFETEAIFENAVDAAGLLDHLAGDVHAEDMLVAQFPQSDGDAPRSAAQFKQRLLRTEQPRENFFLGFQRPTRLTPAT